MQVDNITLEMTADRRARLVKPGNVLNLRRQGQQLDHANKRWLHLGGRLPRTRRHLSPGEWSTTGRRSAVAFELWDLWAGYTTNAFSR